MKKSGLIFSTFVFLNILLNSAAFAAPYVPKDTLVSQSDIIQVEVDFTYKGKELTKVVSCYNKVSGTSFTKKGLLYFRTLKEELKFQASNLKIYAKNKKKYTPLKTKYDTLKALSSASTSSCTEDSNPSPDQTAGPTPVPTNSVPSNANFDQAGNVTEKGKITFGIPSNLSANTIKGLQAFNKYTCSGCHVEPGGYSYGSLNAAITTKDPMKTFGVSAQEVVDLVAYLNRGKVY